MKHIKKIFLVWRKGKGARRIPVGVLKRNSMSGVVFSYLKEGVQEAQKDGFTFYTDFPDLNKEYSENVLEIFAQRLTKSERSDIQKYYDFWEINSMYKDDKYYLLAQTGGMLATDNFEFIAEYYPMKDLKFISEICGLSKTNIKSKTLEIGERLDWEIEPANPYDKYAVKILKNGVLLGYVKKMHSRVFYEKKQININVSIKSIEQNEYVNRVFITISI